VKRKPLRLLYGDANCLSEKSGNLRGTLVSNTKGNSRHVKFREVRTPGQNRQKKRPEERREPEPCIAKKAYPETGGCAERRFCEGWTSSKTLGGTKELLRNSKSERGGGKALRKYQVQYLVFIPLGYASRATGTKREGGLSGGCPQGKLERGMKKIH